MVGKESVKKELAYLAIAAVVLYLLFVNGTGSDEMLTDRTDEEKKKIADKVKGASWYGTLVRVAVDYDIPPKRIAAIVAVESAGNPAALGAAGEKGLMQLMTPAVKDVYSQWGQSYYVALATGLNLFDPKTNLTIGTCYLAILKNRTRSLDQATQDYNDGSLERGKAYLNEVLSFEKFF